MSYHIYIGLNCLLKSLIIDMSYRVHVIYNMID